MSINIEEKGGVVIIAHLLYPKGKTGKEEPYVDQALLERGTAAIFHPQGGCQVLRLGDDLLAYLERLVNEKQFSKLGLKVTFEPNGNVIFDTEENYDGRSRSFQSGHEGDGRAFRIASGGSTGDVYVAIMANSPMGLDNILKIVRKDPELGVYFKHVDSPYSSSPLEIEPRL